MEKALNKAALREWAGLVRQIPQRQAKQQEAKAAWMKAREELEKEQKAIQERIQVSRADYDRTSLLLGEAMKAKAELWAAAPIKLQREEASAGAGVRQAEQRLRMLKSDLYTMRKNLERQEKQRGLTKKQRDEIKRDADRVTYFESCVAQQQNVCEEFGRRHAAARKAMLDWIDSAVNAKEA